MGAPRAGGVGEPSAQMGVGTGAQVVVGAALGSFMKPMVLGTMGPSYGGPLGL